MYLGCLFADLPVPMACIHIGEEVVIEELLEGPEISVLAFSDGYTIFPLPAAQDHKRIGDGDTGPNTGGMGAYAPAPVATPAIMDQIMREALRPTIDGMRKEGKSYIYFILICFSDQLRILGFPFVGLLFTGFMLTESGPKVLEYNVRFGDPETEALMLLLQENVDLAAILLVSTYHISAYIHQKSAPNTFHTKFSLLSGLR
jgi:phosphoribosylamine--glycine ligase / phosphoribosylformylglycinamidine cyclo-ligase